MNREVCWTQLHMYICVCVCVCMYIYSNWKALYRYYQLESFLSPDYQFQARKKLGDMLHLWNLFVTSITTDFSKARIPQKKWNGLYSQKKNPKYSTWVPSQRWQNYLCSFPRQTIQHHSNPSLWCPNHKCWRNWNWLVLWRPTRSSRTRIKKRCLFSHRGLEVRR